MILDKNIRIFVRVKHYSSISILKGVFYGDGFKEKD